MSAAPAESLKPGKFVETLLASCPETTMDKPLPPLQKPLPPLQKPLPPLQVGDFRADRKPAVDVEDAPSSLCPAERSQRPVLSKPSFATRILQIAGCKRGVETISREAL